MRSKPVRTCGCLLACLLALLPGSRAAAGDLDLTPLGGWPDVELSPTIYGVPTRVLANGRFFQRGAYLGAPALLALEPAGANPFQLVGALPLPDIRRIAVAGHYAVVMSSGRLFVVDISDPSQLRFGGMAWLGTVEDGTALRLAVSGTHAYVADVTRGIRVFDIGDPARPREVGGTSAVNAYRLVAAGDRLFAAAGGSGLAEFELFAAPLGLGILHSGNTVKLTWPITAAGFALESSRTLTPMADWLPEPTAPEIVGDQNVVTLESGPGPRFFRLKQP